MHEPTPIATIAILVITGLVSFAGFRDPAVVDRFIFSPQRILVNKEGWRLFTSGFLHANWPHLIFNMISLYMFGKLIEIVHGPYSFLFIYFMSIIGGDLLSLYLHRHHEYLSLGASGGVCGVIYAAIFLFPGTNVMMMFLPIPIPTWLYAILYLGLSYYGLRKGHDNIGHDAHLGGAIVGLLVTTALYPYIVKANPLLYAAVMAISVAMLVFLVVHPLYLPARSFEAPDFRPTKPKPGPPRADPTSDEVNRILEKISKSGMESLTKAEHDTLQKASRKKQ